MPPAKLSDDEFLRIIKQHGITEKSAKLIGSNVRNINYRRRRLENKYDEPVAPPSRQLLNYPGRYRFNIKNGTVLVGSDFHIWPGETSTCLRAFKKFVADIKPAAVILNGDVMDFPRISRHPQNWEARQIHRRRSRLHKTISTISWVRVSAARRRSGRSVITTLGLN
jgi:hypothetical protein